ncbi:MAG: hypothetical protein H7X79_02540 [Sporomusaceae bacterium]|nr:hypothetical protein [Sporomusaceae bacterium]
MINSQNFEIPDGCATDTRQCTECLPPIFTCAANFGLTCPPITVPTCECHDICVEEVRLIALAGGTCEFTQCFSYPPIGPCRLGAGITLPIIDTAVQPRVFVICAQEVLDSTTCQVINVQIQLLILAATISSGNVLIPLTINVAFDTFFRFPDCSTVLTGAALQNALTEIDGSCLVIQLRAVAAAVGAAGTVQITLEGKIIDKLWKHENLWVTGIRPYDLNDAQRAAGFVSFTIPDVFNNSHTIGPCGPLVCV